MISAFMMLQAPISRQLSHGLVKPLPSLRWCFLSFVSSGTAPDSAEDDIVAAYRAAAAAELDILLDLRGGFGGVCFPRL